MKIELIDIDKKKEGQVLLDISLTPSQRFVRMFDLIEFCAAFSRMPQIILDRPDMNVLTLKKRAT